MKKLRRMYREIKSFEEFVDTDVLFLEGKISIVYDNYAPVYDTNTEAPIILHKRPKFFTTDGQPEGSCKPMGPVSRDYIFPSPYNQKHI